MNKVLIYGGLGNQMFQYAFCKSLNVKGKKSRILFSNFFYQYHHNGLDLFNAFNLELSFKLKIIKFFIETGESLYKNKKLAFLLEKLFTKYQNKKYFLYKEKKEFVYDTDVFSQNKSFMVGTWQVEEYFRDLEKCLFSEFRFKKPSDKKNKDLIKEIRSKNSISIHIRRGDYVNSQWMNTHEVIKNELYYINAIKYLESSVKNPHFFIFSDDMIWVQQNLPISNCTHVKNNNGKKSYIDMYLMSLCKHNIIANSTFSWWGAWLNKNIDKIVIIPETWLNNISCPGIFPLHWIKMPVN